MSGPARQSDPPQELLARRMAGEVDAPDNGPPDTDKVGIRSLDGLPDELWEATDQLKLIRRTAHSRLASPDALLGVALARVSAAVPTDLVLPPVVFSAAPLNYFVMIVGRPGEGKSGVIAIGRDLLPKRLDEPCGRIHDDSVRIASGEGLMEAFYTIERDGTTVQRVFRPGRGILCEIDEAELFSKLGQRSGNTTMLTLRSAWSGAGLGTNTANTERFRRVPRMRYRVAVVAGIQPDRAEGLLADETGGLPQRFLWLPAYDPTMPRTPEQIPPYPDQLLRWQHYDYSHGAHFKVDAEIWREIQARRIDGNYGVADLPGHRDQLRLRTAALLACLHNEDPKALPRVGMEFWHLGGILVDYSDATCQAVQDELNERYKTDREIANRHAARREVAVTAATERADRQRAINHILGRFEKIAGEAHPNPVARRVLWSGVASTYRMRLSSGEAFDIALSTRVLAKNGDDGYHLGPAGR